MKVVFPGLVAGVARWSPPIGGPREAPAYLLEEVVTPGGQPVPFDLQLAGELIQRCPTQQAQDRTGSIFLLVYQLGLLPFASLGQRGLERRC
jgi:hypothetical protein